MSPTRGGDRHAPTIRAGFDPAPLRAGHALITSNRDAFATRFTDELFSRYPDIQEALRDDSSWIGRTVTAVVDTILDVADDPEALVSVLERLGVDNRTVGVRSGHYAPIGHALILACRFVGGTAWTSDIDRAWIDGFDIAAEIMVAAADTSARSSGRSWTSGRIVEHVRVMPDSAALLVRLTEPVLARPGHHALVSSPDVPGIWRPFHVVPVPADAHAIELYVRSLRPHGVAAALMSSAVGSEIFVGHTQGTDLMRLVDDRSILAVAVGTGIAPVLALLSDPAVLQDRRRIHVFYGGRTADDLAALDRLEVLGQRFPRLDIVPVVATSGGEPAMARTLADIVESYANWRPHRVIVGGPTEALMPTLDRLRASGVTDDAIVRLDRRRASYRTV